MTRNVESKIELQELDKSAFNDLYSFTGPKNGGKGRLEFKDCMSEKRIEEEKKKIKQRFS